MRDCEGGKGLRETRDGEVTKETRETRWKRRLMHREVRLLRVSTISTLLMDDESQLFPRRVNHFERLPRVVPPIDRAT